MTQRQAIERALNALGYRHCLNKDEAIRAGRRITCKSFAVDCHCEIGQAARILVAIAVGLPKEPERKAGKAPF